jgi:hypothetical protein
MAWRFDRAGRNSSVSRLPRLAKMLRLLVEPRAPEDWLPDLNGFPEEREFEADFLASVSASFL